MSPITDPAFARSLVASAIGAALFVPVDSMPWWLALLRDLPLGGWLWPIGGGAVTLLVYRMGVRAGTIGGVVVESRNDVQEVEYGSRPGDVKSESGTTMEIVVHPDAAGMSELDNPDSVIQVALSLNDTTDVEAERRTARYIGQSIIIRGVVANVRVDDHCVSVYVLLDHHDPTGEPVRCHCHLDFHPKLAPALRTLAKGVVLQAKGTVRRVEREAISLEECELLRISGATTD